MADEQKTREGKSWRDVGWLAQTCFSRSAAFLTDPAQGPRTFRTGPRYSLSNHPDQLPGEAW